jgi:hypothetical protein
MIGRRFAVPEPVSGLASGARLCTFLVEYPGTTAAFPPFSRRPTHHAMATHRHA